MVVSIATQIASHVARRQLTTSPAWRPCTDSLVRPSRFLHASCAGQFPRKRQFFSSNAALQEEVAANSSPNTLETPSQVQKRKAIRSPAGNRSLRRVAVEAQKSREKTLQNDGDAAGIAVGGNEITAVCVAEEFNMAAVVKILRSHGFEIDPDRTGFLDEQVVHARGVNDGDIFVFPSGILVTWSLPEDVAVNLATQTLKPATVNPHFAELEDLEFKEDASRDTSSIRGDVITLGVKSQADETSKADTTLAKIAFSSGLARSTKLAVLETMLSKYFSSTRSIPTLLAKGSKIPFDRKFILKKTGELLELRAQLNHYSELTDSLPDLFWDSRHELGLEGYYDQVGKALDVGVRIKTLNDKMDYAQESASVMRETLSQKHSSDLEIIIIVLITIEVAFGIRAIWKDVNGEKSAAGH